MSGNYVNINANNRNTPYTVTLYAYNTRFDGGNGLSAQTSFTVYEANPQVCIDCSGYFKDADNTQQAWVPLNVYMNASTGRGRVIYHWASVGDYEYANIVATGWSTFYWSEWNANSTYNGSFYWTGGASNRF